MHDLMGNTADVVIIDGKSPQQESSVRHYNYGEMAQQKTQFYRTSQHVHNTYTTMQLRHKRGLLHTNT